MIESARGAFLQPFLSRPLSPRIMEQVSAYLELLQKWNARINLTAIRSEAEILTRHFGESFFLAQLLFDQGVEPKGNAHRVVDIGSGAGFPAIPIKLWAEDVSLTMIEANHKKAAFLREVVRTLALGNVQVISDRAEIVAAKSDFPRADIVTSEP